MLNGAVLKPKLTGRCSRVAWLAALLMALAIPQRADAFAFIFAGETYGVDVVTHPLGYTGTGGTLNISVGIDPTSANASDMVISVQNMVNTWNGLTSTTGNLVSGGSNNVPVGDYDFESVALHELGHGLGLAHMNLASESGLSGNDMNYTKSTDGANNVFNIDAGTDTVIGSADDVRGDDVNMNYFKTADNNPFTLAGTIDSTTYSRDLADLPGGDNYSANADRAVGVLLGYADSEGVMQQGTFADEAQRDLAADDVAGIRYAMSGLDETVGGGDDYTINLTYAGLDAGADIVLDFDNAQTGFAVCQTAGLFINPTHVRVTSAPLYFNTGYDWFFNDVSNSPTVPEPSTLVLLGAALGAGLIARRRRRKS